MQPTSHARMHYDMCTYLHVSIPNMMMMTPNIGVYFISYRISEGVKFGEQTIVNQILVHQNECGAW